MGRNSLPCSPIPSNLGGLSVLHAETVSSSEQGQMQGQGESLPQVLMQWFTLQLMLSDPSFLHLHNGNKKEKGSYRTMGSGFPSHSADGRGKTTKR